MELYNDRFQHISFMEEVGLLQKSWTTESDQMNEDTFQSEVTTIAEMIELQKPVGVCDDTTNFLYAITPELQTWVSEAIFPRFIAAGVKKYAIIVSSEMIAQLSVEQTMEEGNAAFQVAYFDHVEKAMEWLKKN